MQREAVEALTRGLANKFLHAPLQALRSAAEEGNGERVAQLRDTFQLPEPQPAQAAELDEPPVQLVELPQPVRARRG